MAAVAGTIFDDFTGNGITPDDTPLGDVFVELIRDDNGNGPLDDFSIAGTTSDPVDGSYAFDMPLVDGHYFIKQTPPVGAWQTTNPAFFAFDVVDDMAYATETLAIDGFDSPDPVPRSYVIAGLDSSPLEVTHQDATILGGQRDIRIEVLGAPSIGSATIDIGEGNFSFGTHAESPGSLALVEYNQLGQPGASDLTNGGASTGFRIDFIEGVNAAGAAGVPLEIRVISDRGFADFSGEVPNNLALSSSFYIPFSAFDQYGDFSFGEVQRLAFELNHEGIVNVDFVLDMISTVNHQTTGYDFGNYEPQPDIDIEKATNGIDADSPTGPIVPVGSTVTWTYDVTNPGNLPLADVVVTDDNGTPLDPADDFPLTLVDGDTNGNGLLDLTETWQYETTLTAVAGQHESWATVVGTPVVVGGEVPVELEEDVTDTDPTHHFSAEAVIDIEKATNGDDADSPTGPMVWIGSTVTWSYEVTNPGNVSLDNVTVTDDSGVVLIAPADANGLLDPG
ncbi:MAG TPA: hypothetical protein VE890_10925, partial [Thermoguttaceae bacterium]|nr:hypothetical protein [Thermoguttaceae bacterium]